MINNWEVFILVAGVLLIVMVRLDRLGKQLEAVCHYIIYELTPDNDRKRELMDLRRETLKEEAKEKRQFWLFWGIIGALALIWAIYSGKFN